MVGVDTSAAPPRDDSLLAGPLPDNVLGVPGRPVRILPAGPLLVLAVRAAARLSAVASSVDKENVVSSASTRPVSCRRPTAL
jgi:hypothetical protein